MKNNNIKLWITVFVLFFCTSASGVVANDMTGWSILNMNSPDFECNVDYELKKSDPCLYVKYKSELEANKYIKIETPVKVKAGSSYVFGASIKSKNSNVGAVTLTMDWDLRMPAINKVTFDWTEVSAIYNSSKSISRVNFNLTVSFDINQLMSFTASVKI